MSRKTKFPHWIWPLSLAMAGAGSAAAVLFRGCWHRNISWPIRHDEHYSYVVCTSCGIKRLFDEKQFREFGPYGYDIEELISEHRARHIERIREHEKKVKPEQKKEERPTWSPEI